MTHLGYLPFGRFAGLILATAIVALAPVLALGTAAAGAGPLTVLGDDRWDSSVLDLDLVLR
ncbi:MULTISPECIES: hypothetical protein [Saccharothrix]|uniref:hypothetical protein n=1 Tax=Saccharothrix TaxID=2071 RepID=UPI00093C35B9|nr:hypothetical protein [Saccharothrix sp. CB00851]OKI31983.1 hypothetical protein A6A25_26430 [Saccharothrix sp. CB00851]